MPRIKRVIWITASLVLMLFGTSALGLFALESAAAQPSGDVIYLEQGWSQADRASGTTRYRKAHKPLAYDIYLNLEVAGSQELFRSDANSERFGLIPQAANPQTNPDGLADRSDQNRVHPRSMGRSRNGGHQLCGLPRGAAEL